MEGTPLLDGWLYNFAVTLFEMLFVGLFEEIAFRALINDAIIYQFRKFKYVWVLAAVVSSFIFGYVHVMYEPLNSPLMVGQVVGKTISTGLFGLASLYMFDNLEKNRQDHGFRRNERKLVSVCNRYPDTCDHSDHSEEQRSFTFMVEGLFLC